MSDNRTDLGYALEEGLREALTWKRGELPLQPRIVDPIRCALRDAEQLAPGAS